MNKKMITKDHFDRTAALAMRFFEDARDLDKDDPYTYEALTEDEAYARALADLRSLLFDYS